MRPASPLTVVAGLLGAWSAAAQECGSYDGQRVGLVAAAAATDGVGGFTELHGARAVATFEAGSRTYAIVASSSDDGIQLVDVSDPSSPRAVGAATDGVGGFTELDGARAVATFEAGSRTYAIVASAVDDGIQLVDVSDPSSPRAVGAATDGVGGFTELDGASGVATFEAGSRTYAIVASSSDDGIQLVSLPECGCSAGEYDDDSDAATPCLPCGPGHVTDTLSLGGATTCTPCSGSYYDHDYDSTTACSTCSTGSFATPLACDGCPSGTADLDADPSTPCDTCPSGSFSSSSQTTCAACLPGTADTDSDPATRCIACQPGFFAPAEATGCVRCPAGYIDQDSNPATPCDSTDLHLCPAGSYAAAGSTECVDCAPGYADLDSDPSTPCSPCTPGHQQTIAAQTSCDPCSEGTADTDSNPATACENCEPGSYAPQAGILCSACPSGEADTDSDPATACFVCGPGHVTDTLSLGGATTCTPCSGSYYDHDYDSTTACSTCSTGSFATPLACDGCPSGTADLDADPSTPCDTCPSGSFSSSSQTTCAACLPGTADTDSDPATRCIACQPGFFAPAEATGCVRCPAGYIDQDSNPATPCNATEARMGEATANVEYMAEAAAAAGVAVVSCWMCCDCVAQRKSAMDKSKRKYVKVTQQASDTAREREATEMTKLDDSAEVPASQDSGRTKQNDEQENRVLTQLRTVAEPAWVQWKHHRFVYSVLFFGWFFYVLAPSVSVYRSPSDTGKDEILRPVAVFELVGSRLPAILSNDTVFTAGTRGGFPCNFPWLADRLCLPLPEYYDLSDESQAIAIPIIYGLMRASLLMVSLVSLPMCHGLVTWLSTAQCCGITGIGLSDWELFHRILGVLAIVGIGLGACVWMITMGLACGGFTPEASNATACGAFNLEVKSPIANVMALRLIVAPTWFTIFPLMYWAQVKWEDIEREGNEQQNCCQKLWWRVTHPITWWCYVVFLSCSASAAVLLEDTRLIAVAMLAACIVQPYNPSPSCGSFSRLRRPAANWVKRHWYEVCYRSHQAVAYTTIPLALYSRFDVFWPCLLFWPWQLLDKLRVLLVHSIIAYCCPRATRTCWMCQCCPALRVHYSATIDAEESKTSSFFRRGANRHRKRVLLRLRLSDVDVDNFAKNAAGRWVFLKIPAISNSEWHPFSLASSQHRTIELIIDVHEHVEVDSDESLGAGKSWTSKLYEQVNRYALTRNSTRSAADVQESSRKRHIEQTKIAFIRGPFGSTFAKCFATIREKDGSARTQYDLSVVFGSGLGLPSALSALRQFLRIRSEGKANLVPARLVYVWQCQYLHELELCWHTLQNELQKHGKPKIEDTGLARSSLGLDLSQLTSASEPEAEMELQDPESAGCEHASYLPMLPWNLGRGGIGVKVFFSKESDLESVRAELMGSKHKLRHVDDRLYAWLVNQVQVGRNNLDVVLSEQMVEAYKDRPLGNQLKVCISACGSYGALNSLRGQLARAQKAALRVHGFEVSGDIEFFPEYAN